MRRRRLVPLLVALGALGLLDAGISTFLIRDGLFRGVPVPPFGAVTHPRQRAWIDALAREDGPGNGRFDAELGWTWKAPSVDPDGVMIGPLGTRGAREYEPEKPAGTLRLVTFGDSFTFCDEIADHFTFQHIFELRHPDAEALNFGVSGYGTDQALLRFRSLGRDLDADVVSIGILLENIGRNVNRFRPLWSTRTGFCATKPRFVLAGGELVLVPQPFETREALRAALLDRSVIERIAEHEYWLGRPHLGPFAYSGLARLAATVLAERERTPRRLWLEPDGEPYRATLALLARFHAEALESGARLAPILVFPTQDDLELVLRGKAYWGGFLADLERRGLPALDLAVPLAERERELRRDPSQGSLYFRSHLSSVGNSVVADTLWAWIEENSP